MNKIISILLLIAVTFMPSCKTTEVCTNTHSFFRDGKYTVIRHGTYFNIKGSKAVLTHFEGSSANLNMKCRVKGDTIFLDHKIGQKTIKNKFYNER